MGVGVADSAKILIFQQFTTVVGIKVNLSNNHTEEGRDGKTRIPISDICDCLKGEYPKTFKFIGWHPQCKCFATPIMKSLEEVDKDVDEDGNYTNLPSANQVYDVPQNFKDYVKDNEERMKGWSSTPYYLKDNSQFVDEALHPEKYLKKPLILDADTIKRLSDFDVYGFNHQGSKLFNQALIDAKKAQLEGDLAAFEKSLVEMEQYIKPQFIVPKCMATNQHELKEYVLNHIAVEFTLNVEKKDIVLLNGIMTQIAQRMEQFNIRKFRNIGVPSSKKAIASWDEHDNSLNLSMNLLRNPESIWKAELKYRKKGIRYSSIDSEEDLIRNVIDHEIGHKLLHQYRMVSDATQVQVIAGKTIVKKGKNWNEIGDVLGYYSSTDIDEFFAEAFAKYFGKNREEMVETKALIERMISKVKEGNTIKSSFDTTFSTSNVVGIKPTERKDIRLVVSVMDSFAKKNKGYFVRGYNGIQYAQEGEAYFMSTDLNGTIYINFAEKDGFDAGASLVSAFEKIANNGVLTKNEEYAMEALWHEVMHNRTKKLVDLPAFDSSEEFPRVVAETVNQLVARHTYLKFLRKFGYEAKETKWVLENGYGYDSQVANLRTLLNKAGINEEEFVKSAEKLLLEDYTDIDKKIKKLLSSMYKGRGDVEGMFLGLRMKREDFSYVLENFSKI